MMGKGKSSICIDCVKSCGLCTWSSKLKPVKGWTAKPIKRVTKDKIYDGYLVTECPLFEKVERKYRENLWTSEENKILKDMMRKRTSIKDIAIVLERSYGAVNAQMTKLRREN